jgi:hypothetical protein
MDSNKKNKDIPTPIINNWTPQNEATLNNWKNLLAEALFVYNYVYTQQQAKLNRLLVVILFLTTFSTILSGVSTTALTVNYRNITFLTISDQDPSYKIVALTFNCVLIAISGISAILTGIIHIYKYNDSISSILAYSAKIEYNYALICNQLLLPVNLRTDAVTFISKESENYLTLTEQSPILTDSEQKEATKKYAAYLKNEEVNFKLTQMSGINNINIDGL